MTFPRMKSRERNCSKKTDKYTLLKRITGQASFMRKKATSIKGNQLFMNLGVPHNISMVTMEENGMVQTVDKGFPKLKGIATRSKSLRRTMVASNCYLGIFTDGLFDSQSKCYAFAIFFAVAFLFME